MRGVIMRTANATTAHRQIEQMTTGVEAARILLSADKDNAALLDELADARRALGHTDHVTLLPNRVRFFDDLDQSYDQATQRLVLVTLVEASKYNGILRALGYCFADEFVRLASKKILESMPTDCRLYHVGVLSFAFLLPEVRKDKFGPIAANLLHSFSTPLACRGLPIETKIGLGLFDFSVSTTGPAEALRSALVAAQESRHLDCGYAHYNQKSDRAHLRAFTILRDLERGLKTEDQFTLHFQPKVDLTTGECRGAEALLRWTHPELGVISPGEFIPLVETTALITPLTNWVLDRSFSQLAKWRQFGLDLKLSINISPSNFSEPNFRSNLLQLASESGIPPQMVDLEFTEGQMLSSERDVVSVLEQLRNDGFGLAIDDFGTGYCNLNYLSKIPANIIKIDQSLVRSVETDEKSCKLLSLIVSLVVHLQYRVVAEGIETESAYNIVTDLGCDEGQGYYMSKPLTARAFEVWLQERAAVNSRSPWTFRTRLSGGHE